MLPALTAVTGSPCALRLDGRPVVVDGSNLIVRVDPGGDGDREEVAGLVRRLRAELLELDVELVEPVTEATAPPGAKGLAGLAGALSVRLGAAGLKLVLAKVRDWVTRNGRSVEVSIDGDMIKITGATAQQQEQLVGVWLARHAPGS